MEGCLRLPLFRLFAPANAPRSRAVGRSAEVLLETWGSAIYRCAYSYVRNPADAEEILQETMLRFLQAKPLLETPAHEKAWLLRVAANLSKNRLRYNSLRRADPLPASLRAEEREDLSFVWEAVGALPEHLRAVVHLYYYEGYSTGEIAAILGRQESTIRSGLHRARAKLKEILKEDYDLEERLP